MQSAFSASDCRRCIAPVVFTVFSKEAGGAIRRCESRAGKVVIELFGIGYWVVGTVNTDKKNSVAASRRLFPAWRGVSNGRLRWRQLRGGLSLSKSRSIIIKSSADFEKGY